MAERTREGRRIAGVVALAGVALGALYGLVVWRGPQAAYPAVATMVLSAATGWIAAKIARTRSAYLLAPAAVVGCWLSRLGRTLPSLRAPAPEVLSGSTWAIGIAVVFGAVEVLVGVLPMLVAIAAARSWTGDRKRLGRVVTGALVLLLGAGAVALAVPPSTPAIPGGVSEIWTVDVRGCAQQVILRGPRADAPIVMFLSGGPGGTQLGTLRNLWGDIEKEFTVAIWDQTAAGANGACYPEKGTLTVRDLVEDAAVVAGHLKDRFGHRVYLVGESWGSFLGVLTVQAHPELFAALFGSGQMVDLTATDTMFWEDGIAFAERSGNAALADRLRAQGPPPYASIYDYETVFGLEGSWNVYERDPRVAALMNPLTNIFDKPELSLMAKLRYLPNLIDALGSVYATAQGIDFRRTATRLEVPYYYLDGAHEARGRQVIAREWFALLQAPDKVRVEFPASGHNPFAQEAGRMVEILRAAVAAHPA